MKCLRNITSFKVNQSSTIINNNNMNKDYKKPIIEILSSSSLAFLLSPFRSKRFLIKIIWTIFLICFLLGSIYNTCLNIIDYLKYYATTNIYHIQDLQVEFPTVSICGTRKPNEFNIKILYFWFHKENLIEEWQNHIESDTDPI